MSNDYNKRLLDAAPWGKHDDMYYALRKGADINARDENGNTALMLAAAHSQYSFARELLSRKADHMLTDKSGLTAAGIAWHHNNTHTFRVLADYQVQTSGPFWIKPKGQIVAHVTPVQCAGMLCEHFDFADKMCTSILYGYETMSHSRTSFNSVARPLLAEAQKQLRAEQPRPAKLKLAEL